MENESKPTVAPTHGQRVNVPRGTQRDDVDRSGVAVRRTMRVARGSVPEPASAGGGPPAKGRTARAAQGRSAAGTTGEVEMVGPRALYALTRRGGDAFETPVFEADGGEALIVFTTPDRAQLYLQTADWHDFEPVDLSPFDLRHWLTQARDEGVRAVLVDPNRNTHERGAAQPALRLDQTRDFSGEGLYDEIWSLGNP